MPVVQYFGFVYKVGKLTSYCDVVFEEYRLVAYCIWFYICCVYKSAEILFSFNLCYARIKPAVTKNQRVSLKFASSDMTLWNRYTNTFISKAKFSIKCKNQNKAKIKVMQKSQTHTNQISTRCSGANLASKQKEQRLCNHKNKSKTLTTQSTSSVLSLKHRLYKKIYMRSKIKPNCIRNATWYNITSQIYAVKLTTLSSFALATFVREIFH